MEALICNKPNCKRHFGCVLPIEKGILVKYCVSCCEYYMEELCLPRILLAEGTIQTNNSHGNCFDCDDPNDMKGIK